MKHYDETLCNIVMKPIQRLALHDRSVRRGGGIENIIESVYSMRAPTRVSMQFLHLRTE